jgi:hypothetical protein
MTLIAVKRAVCPSGPKYDLDKLYKLSNFRTLRITVPFLSPAYFIVRFLLFNLATHFSPVPKVRILWKEGRVMKIISPTKFSRATVVHAQEFDQTYMAYRARRSS